jgi:hypothetical protein
VPPNLDLPFPLSTTFHILSSCILYPLIMYLYSPNNVMFFSSILPFIFPPLSWPPRTEVCTPFPPLPFTLVNLTECHPTLPLRLSFFLSLFCPCIPFPFSPTSFSPSSHSLSLFPLPRFARFLGYFLNGQSHEIDAFIN